MSLSACQSFAPCAPLIDGVYLPAHNYHSPPLSVQILSGRLSTPPRKTSSLFISQAAPPRRKDAAHPICSGFGFPCSQGGIPLCHFTQKACFHTGKSYVFKKSANVTNCFSSISRAPEGLAQTLHIIVR